MKEPYPFLALSKFTAGPPPAPASGEKCQQQGASLDPTLGRVAAGTDYSVRLENNGQVCGLFEDVVSAVQSGFQHLSTDDIVYPPHQWFDAALARQIAVHIMIARFNVPRRRLVEELQRSRIGVKRAMDVVSQRMLNEDFASSYEAMAIKAKNNAGGAK